MKNTIPAAGVALASLIGASANATTITLSTFDITSFNAETAGGTIQDFEGFSGAWNSSTITNVGTFTSVGGTGSGSVCNAQSGGNCQSLFINDTVLSGQGNLVRLNGTKALSSNDTNGIFWDVFGTAGSVFSKIVLQYVTRPTSTERFSRSKPTTARYKPSRVQLTTTSARFLSIWGAVLVCDGFDVQQPVQRRFHN